LFIFKSIKIGDGISYLAIFMPILDRTLIVMIKLIYADLKSAKIMKISVISVLSLIS